MQSFSKPKLSKTDSQEFIKSTALEILRGIFEAYVNIRGATKWDLSKLDEPNPSYKIPHKKLDALIEILKRIDRTNISNTKECIELLYFFHDKEVIEDQNKTGNMLGGLVGMVAGNEKPYLAHALRAAKAYIISLYENDIKKILVELHLQQQELEKAILNHKDNHSSADIIAKRKEELAEVTKRIKALDTSKDHTAAFYAIIEKEDPKRVELNTKNYNEDSFEKFCANIISGARKFTICPKLLACVAKASNTITQTQVVNDNQSKPLVTEQATAPVKHEEPAVKAEAATPTIKNDDEPLKVEVQKVAAKPTMQSTASIIVATGGVESQTNFPSATIPTVSIVKPSSLIQTRERSASASYKAAAYAGAPIKPLHQPDINAKHGQEESRYELRRPK